jgi:hypothetical protein
MRGPTSQNKRYAWRFVAAFLLGIITSYVIAWTGYLYPGEAVYANFVVLAPDSYKARNPGYVPPGAKNSSGHLARLMTAKGWCMARLCIKTGPDGFTPQELDEVILSTRTLAVQFDESNGQFAPLYQTWPPAEGPRRSTWTEWITVTAGFPMHCLHATSATDQYATVINTGTLEIFHFTLLPAVGPSLPPGILPLRPMWPALLANSALYALPWWLILSIPSAYVAIRSRRRKRLNHCPHCNYNRETLAPTAPCPECGASR